MSRLRGIEGARTTGGSRTTGAVGNLFRELIGNGVLCTIKQHGVGEKETIITTRTRTFQILDCLNSGDG